MGKIRQLSRVAALVVAILLTFPLTSCDGFFPSSDTIVSLAISPTGAWIKPGTTQQFSATATFGNNTTGDVTSQVTWLSSSESVATIDTTGLATAVALGNSTITAKSTNSSATATAVMTVSSKTISAITINPTNVTLSLIRGQTQQFTATVTFSDGSIGNLTTNAGWVSSNPNVATISNSGLATPVSAGSTTISASAGGVAATTSLTVQ